MLLKIIRSRAASVTGGMRGWQCVGVLYLTGYAAHAIGAMMADNQQHSAVHIVSLDTWGSVQPLYPKVMQIPSASGTQGLAD